MGMKVQDDMAPILSGGKVGACTIIHFILDLNQDYQENDHIIGGKRWCLGLQESPVKPDPETFWHSLVHAFVLVLHAEFQNTFWAWFNFSKV